MVFMSLKVVFNERLKMRFIQGSIASLVKAIKVAVFAVVLPVLVPRSDIKAIARMLNDGKITEKQGKAFIKHYISAGGRFGVSRLDTMTSMAQLAGYGTSIRGISNFIKDYLK